MSSIKGIPAMDVLPEYFPYRDDGCDVSPSCLRCTLPKCKFDDPGWLHRERRAQRDAAILRARQRESLTVEQLSRRFSISQRTVHRILQHAKNGHRKARLSSKSLVDPKACRRPGHSTMIPGGHP
ncbi:MAG: hypothetical protein HY535_05790 [Chloroflexi bacterium]|nr:hypothetical protein [Chloroflexota bacterium]